MVRTRRKREMNLRFLLRHAQAKDLCPRPLQIRLFVNGERASDYSTDVYILPSQWDQHAQRVKGRTQLVDQANERLGEIRAKHSEILRELKRRYDKGEGHRPTARLVKAEFTNPGSTSPTLIKWYRTYLNFLDSLHGSSDGKAEKTMQSLYKTLDHLIQFENPSLVKSARRLGKYNDPLLCDITTGWGKRFHAWLQINPDTGKRRAIKDTANRHLAHVRDAINYAIDEGFLATNLLDRFRPKRGKGKEVYFLEPEHLERLLELNLSDQAGIVLWWARLMCLTGLDYVDAVRYARNRQEFHKRNDVGLKIVIERSKPPMNTCEIPLIGQVYDLVDA